MDLKREGGREGEGRTAKEREEEKQSEGFLGRRQQDTEQVEHMGQKRGS